MNPFFTLSPYQGLGIGETPTPDEYYDMEDSSDVYRAEDTNDPYDTE